MLIPIELLLLNKVIIASLVLKFILTVILDVTFLSDFSFSLKLGVNGVGFSNIITEGANTTLLAFFIIRTLRKDWSLDWNYKWVKEWFRIGFWSGLDSLIRNLVYMLLILRSMNLLSESGLYWTTNTFIWSYVLLPFLPLSEVLRLDISKGRLLNVSFFDFITISSRSTSDPLYKEVIWICRHYCNHHCNLGSFDTSLANDVQIPSQCS